MVATPQSGQTCFRGGFGATCPNRKQSGQEDGSNVGHGGYSLAKEGGVIRHPVLTQSDELVSADNVHLGLVGQEQFILDFAAFFNY